MKAKYLLGFMLCVLLCACNTYRSVRDRPDISRYNHTTPVVQHKSDSLYCSGNDFLLRNRQQLWELYVEGDPLQRGLSIGGLADSLIQRQDRIFFSKIGEWVPSRSKQKMIRRFIKYYNRKLYKYVPEEYKTEIYGISEYTTHDYDYIAPRYLRSLYLHGAHDIGHALQDLAIVGCTSFAVWGDKSADGSLLLGRNFDFYAGDDFARNKIVAFMRPDSGHNFMMVTWPGMIGAVSGMNDQGITVTINAAKSKVPLIARTPISILTREILQYASNIDEAIAIAKHKRVFVSESIMVGSAHDKKAIIIEVTPKNVGIYEVPNSSQLICANQFQSDALKDGKRNRYQIINSHSQYRYNRMAELIGEGGKLDPTAAASILRNKEGMKGLPIGYGNEKALNQLRAHHSVIFKPEQGLVWVSANPYQLGEYVCYDLNKIFSDKNFRSSGGSLAEQSLNIPADPFLGSSAYKDYEQFRQLDLKMDTIIKKDGFIDKAFAENYQSLNPDYWVVYYKVGMYYYYKHNYELAKEQFEKALTKEVTTLPEKQNIEYYLQKSRSK